MTGENELLLRLVQRWWMQADKRVKAVGLLPISNNLIALKPEIGTTFYNAFLWVDAFLKG